MDPSPIDDEKLSVFQDEAVRRAIVDPVLVSVLYSETGDIVVTSWNLCRYFGLIGGTGSSLVHVTVEVENTFDERDQ